MGRILIRNLDDEIIAALRRRAADDGVSLEEETRRALAEAVGLRKAQWLVRMDEIRARIGKIPGESTLEILRADRARDDDKEKWRSS